MWLTVFADIIRQHLCHNDVTTWQRFLHDWTFSVANTPVIYGFTSQRANSELTWWTDWHKPELAAEQMIEFPVTRDAIKLMWRLSNTCLLSSHSSNRKWRSMPNKTFIILRFFRSREIYIKVPDLCNFTASVNTQCHALIQTIKSQALRIMRPDGKNVVVGPRWIFLAKF